MTDLRARFPDHEDPATGCDEDDNTASADIAFRTGLPRAEALNAGERVVKSNGWNPNGGRSGCYTKQIRGEQITAQFVPPDEYDEAGIDLIFVMSTQGCWS